MTQSRQTPYPLRLIVAAGPARYGRWQMRVARDQENCARIEMDPGQPAIRNPWLSRIDQAVGMARRPVVLAGDGLGALAIVWWAALLGKAAARHVKGALLVFPDDPERPGFDAEGFGPLPTAMLPFPSIVVAARDHLQVSLARHREMAGQWLSDFVALEHERDIGRRDGGCAEQLMELLADGGPGLSHYQYRAEPLTRPPSRWPRQPTGAARRL